MANILSPDLGLITARPETVQDQIREIVGRPYMFQASADPADRTFIRHMMPGAPLVSFRPGRVTFSQDISDSIERAKAALKITSDGDVLNRVIGASDRGTVFDPSLRYGVSEDAEAAIDAAIREKQKGTTRDWVDKNNGALRYFEFQPAFDDFVSVYATLSSRVFSRIRGKAARWNDFDTTVSNVNRGGFFTFWANNASSVSESFTAEVGETVVAGLVKKVSDLSRQAQFLLKESQLSQENAGLIKSAMSAVESVVGGSNASGLRASLGSAILGLNPMFPEVWKDSSFSRSYNVSFKFYSPYGHPGAVYQNVIAPFLLLVSMVSPVNRGPSMYSTPFIFQMDCPGYFACDLGICTSFDFVKGGSDNLWTTEGLPRQIDVTMQVRDLYPVLTSSPNAQSMYFNVGMGTFLDNLAGISLAQIDNGMADVITRLRGNLFSALQQGSAVFSNAAMQVQRLSERSGVAGLTRGAVDSGLAASVASVFK